MVENDEKPAVTVTVTAMQPVKAPPELYDHDIGREHWLRADLYETCGQAKYAAQGDLGFGPQEWTRIGVRKVWCRHDSAYIELASEEGTSEPYDGWPWVSCSKDDPGAVAYWHVFWR